MLWCFQILKCKKWKRLWSLWWQQMKKRYLDEIKVFMWVCTIILIIPCIFLRYFHLKKYILHTTMSRDDCSLCPCMPALGAGSYNCGWVRGVVASQQWLPWEFPPPPPHESGKMFKLSDHFFIFRWEMRERVKLIMHPFCGHWKFWANMNSGRRWPRTTWASWWSWFYSYYFLHTPGFFHIRNCLYSSESWDRKKQRQGHCEIKHGPRHCFRSFIGQISRSPGVLFSQLLLSLHLAESRETVTSKARCFFKAYLNSHISSWQQWLGSAPFIGTTLTSSSWMNRTKNGVNLLCGNKFIVLSTHPYIGFFLLVFPTIE